MLAKNMYNNFVGMNIDGAFTKKIEFEDNLLHGSQDQKKIWEEARKHKAAVKKARQRAEQAHKTQKSLYQTNAFEINYNKGPKNDSPKSEHSFSLNSDKPQKVKKQE